MQSWLHATHSLIIGVEQIGKSGVKGFVTFIKIRQDEGFKKPGAISVDLFQELTATDNHHFPESRKSTQLHCVFSDNFLITQRSVVCSLSSIQSFVFLSSGLDVSVSY